MGIFNIDSPLMQALSKMADLMILGIISLICCLPIFTIGASLTALDYSCLKLSRGEDTHIVRGFFRSFGQNFRQSTLIWLVFLVIAALVIGDLFIMFSSDMDFNIVIRVVVIAVAVVAVFTLMYVFPLQGRFENTIKQTVKNALIVSILQLPRTLLMIVVWCIPTIIGYFFMQILPIVIVFYLSAPAYVSAKLYDKTFQKMEDQVTGGEPEEAETDDESIFSEPVFEGEEMPGDAYTYEATPIFDRAPEDEGSNADENSEEENSGEESSDEENADEDEDIKESEEDSVTPLISEIPDDVMEAGGSGSI